MAGEETTTTSTGTISAVDTFTMQRCMEFISNRKTDFDGSYESLKKLVKQIEGAWTGKGTQTFLEGFGKEVEGIKEDASILDTLSKLLKDAVERHGTATKTAESIADSIEIPVWEEEII